MIVYQLISNSSHQPAGSCSRNSGTSSTQNPNSQNYLSLLVTPENTISNKPESNQQTTLTNILPAMITENEALNAIFPFEFEKPSATPLFSEAVLEEKPITVMYTDAKVDGHPIKLILDSSSASTASTRIITANGATKTPIGEIDNFPFEVNGIIILIKVLIGLLRNFNSAKMANTSPLINFEEEKLKPTWETYQVSWADIEHNKLLPILDWKKKNNHGSHLMKTTGRKPTIIASHVIENTMAIQNNKASGTTNHVSLVANSYSMKKCGMTFLIGEECVTLHANTRSSSAIGKLLRALPKSGTHKRKTGRVFSTAKHLTIDNDEGIMPECAHDTDARFDLRYLRKNAIKLEPHLCTCIDLKIALEILATTMVQLAFRSSLVKKVINIRGGIINAGYVENIMAMLQNDLEKAYIIEPNKKITQAIFLPLVKIAQLVSVRNKEELGITARGIQRFRSTGRIDILVNMIEEKTIGQEEFISIGQAISIPPYD
ncbi:hypothetical protein G9A89_003154 [Geosiphon pyriformis]|nr:hypothetical protein G9A89_003154 [Geosiphon pyriformis]